MDINMTDFDLSNRVAIVTGGSKGIGAKMARTLAQYGADVVIVSRNADEGENVAKEIRGLGRKSLALAVDVQDVRALYGMVEKVKEEFGKIDILVNNAGIAITKFALEVTEEEWEL
jgi:NAD(P)-dependent dehydrogenase (short-subunit alcohol dehydrogenase family)